MLEAKAKDQGHNAQVFSKKKVFINLLRGLWRILQDEEKKGYDLGPYFLRIKK